MIYKDIVVIGGGAAGLISAISASSCDKKRQCGSGTTKLSGVALIEHMDRVGKKILSTGNGKCNYTNKYLDDDAYRGNDPSFVNGVFEQFGVDDTIALFKRLGIYPKEKNGYYYPMSEQASSVLDVLRMEGSRLHVDYHVSCAVSSIKCDGGRFIITTDKENFTCGNIIIATGLKAAPKTGSDGSLLNIIQGFGHNIIDVVPALVQLTCRGSFFKRIAGVRINAKVSIYISDKYISSDTGELQLTDYGISGIPVFNVSRYATRALSQKLPVKAVIDFAPSIDGNELFAIMTERFITYGGNKNALDALNGFFNKKLNGLFLYESGIYPDLKADRLDLNSLKKLCGVIKNYEVLVTGSRGFDSAQVCAGGVDTSEINPYTMESKIVKNMYFAGEVIDIDAKCGGYNLQWAWSSGYVAGQCAAAKSGK